MTVTVIFLCLNKSLRSLKTFDICVTCCLVMNSGWTITTNATSQTTLNLWRYLHAALPTSFKLLHLDFDSTLCPENLVQQLLNSGLTMTWIPSNFSCAIFHTPWIVGTRLTLLLRGGCMPLDCFHKDLIWHHCKGSLLLRLLLSYQNFWICSNLGLTMTWIHQNSNVQFIILVLLT